MGLLFFRKKKKKSIKQTRRSVRENFYFNRQLWDCASDHVHEKGDVFHAELPGICFYNATSWKMSRLEQSKEGEETGWQCSHSGSACFTCLDQACLMRWCRLLRCSLAPGTGRHRGPWHGWGGSCRVVLSWSWGFSGEGVFLVARILWVYLKGCRNTWILSLWGRTWLAVREVTP